MPRIAREKRTQAVVTALQECFPPIITRSAVAELTAGAIKKRTLEEDDRLGRGPRRRLYLNGQIAYARSDFLDYLRSKIETVVEVEPLTPFETERHVSVE